MPDPLYGLLFPKIGGSQPHPKLQSLLSQEGVSYGLHIWPVHSRGPSEQKRIKTLGQKGAWTHPGTVQSFKVPPIISGTGKAMDFKFGQYIRRVHPNKSPLKVSKNGSVGISRTAPHFKVPLISQERVKLRTSYS